MAFWAATDLVLERKPQTAALVRTSTALTIFRSGYKFNVCPEKATATVNHRIHPSDTVENVVEYDRKIIDDPRVKIEISRSLRPSLASVHKRVSNFETVCPCAVSRCFLVQDYLLQILQPPLLGCG